MHLQLQFEKSRLCCLRTVTRETQSQEQTQEVRIGDGMPDIGTVIGAWGQVIVRSKEWKSDGMGVSGGTMVWVLYQPEDGSDPQCVETWLPFQYRWSFSSEKDGKILSLCQLKNVDARTVSARKLIVRTGICVQAEGLEPCEAEYSVPGDLPEDIQLRQATYPVMLVTQAGEKAFSLEETFPLPPAGSGMERLISYHLQPEITEQNLIGDRAVFRGSAALHISYMGKDGNPCSWEYDLPFSQFTDLEASCDEDCTMRIWPCVTGLELEQEESQLRLKAGLLCQYRICGRPEITVVEDGYSPSRTVTCIAESLELPGILEERSQVLPIQVTAPVESMRLAAVQFLPQPPSVDVRGDDAAVILRGTFQILANDLEGRLFSKMIPWEETLVLPSDPQTQIVPAVISCGKPQGNLMSGSGQFQAQLQLQTDALLSAGISMVRGMEVSQLREPDPDRPSLVLRRAGEETLWEIAKRTGSTVAAIQQANGLASEPEPEQMLLIPVI